MDGDGTGYATDVSSRDATNGGRVGQCTKEDLFSILCAWKGGVEKVLGDLDRVMASILAGLVKLGLSRKPGRKKGLWAFRQAHKPKPYPFHKSKSKLQFYSKGSLKPSSDPAPETLETLTKHMSEVPPTVGLVLGTSKTLIEDVTKAPLMVGLVPKVLAGASVGSAPASYGVVHVPWTASLSSVFV